MGGEESRRMKARRRRSRRRRRENVELREHEALLNVQTAVEVIN